MPDKRLIQGGKALPLLWCGQAFWTPVPNAVPGWAGLIKH